MLTKLEAEKSLSPHVRTLKKCLDGGWQAWYDHYAARHFMLDARARAAIVYCEIIHLAKNLFADTGVKIVRKGAMHVLYIGEDIVLRFKKLRNGIPSNVRTEQQILIEQQQPIPGFLPGTHVCAGYELDKLEQGIDRTLVVARLEGRQVWSLDLNIGEADSGAIQIMPTKPISPLTTRRVRVRKVAKAMEVPKK